MTSGALFCVRLAERTSQGAGHGKHYRPEQLHLEGGGQTRSCRPADGVGGDDCYLGVSVVDVEQTGFLVWLSMYYSIMVAVAAAYRMCREHLQL